MNYTEMLTGGFKGGRDVSEFSKALGGGAAKAGIALGAIALLAGGRAALSGIQHTMLRDKFQAALKKVMTSNVIVQSADPGKVMSYAATVFQYAPHIAVDPNLLSAILANAVHGEGIDPMTIKTLQEMEERYNRGNTPLSSPVRFPG